ncbi:MAG: hypothetical protein U9N85_01220 [Bacteroidota bacterium]|nr:hypothetical protein [Bacteroidota bacterium]
MDKSTIKKTTHSIKKKRLVIELKDGSFLAYAGNIALKRIKELFTN